MQEDKVNLITNSFDFLSTCSHCSQKWLHWFKKLKSHLMKIDKGNFVELAPNYKFFWRHFHKKSLTDFEHSKTVKPSKNQLGISFENWFNFIVKIRKVAKTQFLFTKTNIYTLKKIRATWLKKNKIIFNKLCLKYIL